MEDGRESQRCHQLDQGPDPELRKWEEFYRNRWQHDKIVRSTHGVNCTGGCTWQIYVKDGIVTWEMQGLDYPLLETGIPPYEPRGCQRGISFSWYLYSPLRVKYPYMRGALLDLWRKARAEHEDPVEAWKSMVEDPEARRRWQRARGKGGFRRVGWDASARADRRGQHLHDQEIRPGPHRRLLADSGDVDDQLCRRGAVPAADGRRVAYLLRLVLRSAAGVARDLGRADRRSPSRPTGTTPSSWR